MSTHYDPESATCAAGDTSSSSEKKRKRPSSMIESFFWKKKEDDGKEEDFADNDPVKLREELKRIDPPVKATDQLAIFRRLTGIHSSPTYKPNKNLGLYRPARNRGIYQHVVEEEKAAKDKYFLFSRLINGCLGLQIIVAASLTALGAGNGPHAVVTVFGAINTVIAGFLTYLKGSGLPERPKFFQTLWSELREHIEQRERDFGREGCGLVVDKEVKKVEEMYKEIKAEVEANRPDGYTSVTRARKRDKGDKKDETDPKVLHTPPTKSTETGLEKEEGWTIG